MQLWIEFSAHIDIKSQPCQLKMIYFKYSCIFITNSLAGVFLPCQQPLVIQGIVCKFLPNL
jgi:hypothetical protein